jgi:CheY-like chemotaxis protein
MALEMPNSDGWEDAEAQGRSANLRIPIIALSAHAPVGEREKALATACNEFDSKPMEFDRLVTAVRFANRK